jgi:YD repeat-containing protein
MAIVQNKLSEAGKLNTVIRQPSPEPRVTARQRRTLDSLKSWLENSPSYHGPAPVENAIPENCEQDNLGNLTAIHGHDGSARFTYDDQQRLIRTQRSGLADIYYSYDEQGRLRESRQASKSKRFHFDHHGDKHGKIRGQKISGLVHKVERGNAGAAVFSHDAEGRGIVARTPMVGLVFDRDVNGVITRVSQTVRGVDVEASFERTVATQDQEGVLSTITISGLPFPVRYEWDELARPSRVLLGNKELVNYRYPSDTACVLNFANGWRETSHRQAEGYLPERWELNRAEDISEDPLIELSYQRDNDHRIITDGVWHYEYDDRGRLQSARAVDVQQNTLDGADNGSDESNNQYYSYRYNKQGNLSEIGTAEGVESFRYGQNGSLEQRQYPNQTMESWHSDEFGRITAIGNCTRHGRNFHYDDADQLTTVRYCDGNAVSLLSDAYDRTTLIESSKRQERLLYGPDNQLLAVYTPDGALLRAYVYGPNGRALAEIKLQEGQWLVYPLHLDPLGNCRVVTDAQGDIQAQISYSPFGLPSWKGEGFTPIYQNRFWCSELCMFDFMARWYDPGAICFLTPDSHTGAPDDERLLHGSAKRLARATMRAGLLGEWLHKPVVRMRYAFCWYDPLNHHDPDGHWPAGAVLLNILGFIWTLPNTLLGLFFEITCIVGEILRWILWLFSGGHNLWEPLGIDAAASSRVHAWAIVFRGGWLGSFPGLMGLTFGNVFFVNGKWEENPELGGPGDVFPEDYHGEVGIPRREAFYEHMLAHTWQSYAWGPLFYFLPPPGVYLWSIIFSGKCDSFMEKDAIRKAGL